MPESTLAGSCVFLSDLQPEYKICEKTYLDLELLFIFSSRSLCGFHITYAIGPMAFLK